MEGWHKLLLAVVYLVIDYKIGLVTSLGLTYWNICTVVKRVHCFYCRNCLGSSHTGPSKQRFLVFVNLPLVLKAACLPTREKVQPSMSSWGVIFITLTSVCHPAPWCAELFDLGPRFLLNSILETVRTVHWKSLTWVWCEVGRRKTEQWVQLWKLTPAHRCCKVDFESTCLLVVPDSGKSKSSYYFLVTWNKSMAFSELFLPLPAV